MFYIQKVIINNNTPENISIGDILGGNDGNKKIEYSNNANVLFIKRSTRNKIMGHIFLNIPPEKNNNIITAMGKKSNIKKNTKKKRKKKKKTKKLKIVSNFSSKIRRKLSRKKRSKKKKTQNKFKQKKHDKKKHGKKK